MSVEEVFARVPPDVEGITLLGGEPFEQAMPLGLIAAKVQARGQSVMTFTGYELGHLRSQEDPGVRALLAATDLLVDGPYLAHQLDEMRPWIGSTNQGLHALTNRYSEVVNWRGVPDRLEVRVSPQGVIGVNGWASTQALEDLLEGL